MLHLYSCNKQFFQEYYMHKRGHGLNPTGKLHDKAVNARIKLKSFKRKLVSENKDHDTTEIDPELNEADIPYNSEIEETIAWLKHNNEPWSEVQKRWKKVARQRHRDIQNNSLNIFSEWPLFKHSLGHTLVEIDYEILKPNNRSQLFQLWPSFTARIVPLLQQKLKDKASLAFLKNFENIDANSRDFFILSSIHVLLKPPIISVGKNESKKSKWKPSIKDAQDSCFLYCSSILDYTVKVENLRQKYHTKGLTLQPIIIVIGKEKKELEYFYSYYDDVLYKFSTLLKCLDSTFKLFHVLNFNYPKEGKQLYLFLESFFYNFACQPNANINSLTCSLRQ
ncbi:uncharacterized protein LOC129945512 [Eupeodes corollae]|uniref:uncharacterized protein LOC129945512 n=1 Tax=Eupeodes corollae TaxID=290404 RepID=UPI00249008C8|nr:uncharacterized protein LOC129945512 [Eupeodes corollae]